MPRKHAGQRQSEASLGDIAGSAAHQHVFSLPCGPQIKLVPDIQQFFGTG
jgi:hypothetical protein